MFRIVVQRSLRLVIELPPPAATATVAVIPPRQRSNRRSSRLGLPRFMSNIIRSAYEDIPLQTLPYAEFIWKNFDEFGDQEALVCGVTGRSYTYELVRLFARKLGSALVKRGLRKGDVLGLICPNIPEFAITFLGVACVGGIITTINPTYTAEEIARQLQDSGAKFVVTVGPLADKVKEAVAMCPLVEETFGIGEAEGLTPLHQVAADLGDSLVECPPIDVAEDVVVMPYSSGTTGLPKGVMLTHQNITTNISQMMHPQLAHVPKPSETMLGILPFFHSYAMSAIMGAGLHFGGRIVTLPRFETDSFLKAIHDHKPNIMHLVPPLVNFLATYPELNVDDLRNLHTIACGAAPLSKNIVSALLERLHPQPIVFQEGYGMTELSPVSHVSPRDSGRIGTCGVLIPNTEAKIVDLNTGAALGPGFEGELCVRGPQVMKGYLNNPRATRETIDRDGWLHTGDIANYDEHGYFHVLDRMKELIKVKGLQVSPSELEDVLLTHPGIEDVAVIGVPDPMAGELPKAYIVPRNSFVSKEDIFAFTESKLAPHKHLKGGIEFVSMIPKTQTGKILRRELIQQMRSQA